jgi:putative phosphoesterase
MIKDDLRRRECESLASKQRVLLIGETAPSLIRAGLDARPAIIGAQSERASRRRGPGPLDRAGAQPAGPDRDHRVVVGVISDTHGLIRPEALQRLRESDVIVHCGDVGAPAVLDALRVIAPVHAVRGNNDKGSWASELPTDDIVEVGNHILYIIHNLAELTLDPSAAGFGVILSGHSHRPFVEDRNGVLFVNPGSAGPRRFSLPVAVALLMLGPGSCNARIIELAA